MLQLVITWTRLKEEAFLTVGVPQSSLPNPQFVHVDDASLVSEGREVFVLRILPFDRQQDSPLSQ